MTRYLTLVLLTASWCSVALASDHDDADVALGKAQTAVKAAESADAATAAAPELEMARNNLAAANGASERHQWKESMMSSEKAQADAELAAARAREKRATAATAEIEASVETLRREIEQPGS